MVRMMRPAVKRMIAISLAGNSSRHHGASDLHTSQGFSLIELLIVLVLIGLGLSLIGPRIGQSLDASRLKASVHAISAAARQARRLATGEQREVTLTIDVDRRTYHVDDHRHKQITPSSAKISMTAARSERTSDDVAAIRFFADGSATGGEVRLSAGRQSYAIEIDWLTGLARIN